MDEELITDTQVGRRKAYLERTKEQRAAYQREWYKKKGGKKRIRPQSREQRTKVDTANRHKKRQLAIEHLGGKCFDCKQIFHPNQYDFHHLRDKLEMVNFNKKLEAILTEADKCVLLCANCHRARHTK